MSSNSDHDTSSETMMDLSFDKSNESGAESDDVSGGSMPPDTDFKPKDLSVKCITKRSKPIPPPLNLRNDEPEPSLGVSTTLKEFAIIATGPHSPLIQKNLPFRKRAHSVPDAVEIAPMSAPPTVLNFFPTLLKQEHSPEGGSSPPLNLSLPPTPRESSSPLETSAVVSSTRPEVASPLISSSSHPSSVESHHNMAQQPFSRHLIPPWSPFLSTPSMMSGHWLNGSPSALLSPAPSSLGSSQEDLRLPAPLPLSSVSNLVYEGDPWRLPWPYPVWHCFQMGTLLRFSINNTDVVMRAEEVNQCSDLQYLTPERLGPLLVQSIIPQESSSGVVNVTFTCVAPGLAADVKIVATCYSHHTFLVMEKGWSAVSPDLVLRQYGIQCQLLECGDCCPQPPKMPAVSSPGICEKFKRFSFSPEELSSSLPTPSSLLLSPPNTPTMKSHHSQHTHQKATNQASQSSKSAKSKQKAGNSQPTEKTPRASTKIPLDPDRPKRPMNAFMLFAKQHRLKLIRMHPGKDNRFVSVILGEAWRQLPADEKEVFIAEAKALSSERKRLNPDCWKRRKTQPPGAGSVGAVKVEASD